MGLVPKAWERTRFSDLAIGRFDSGSFEPDQWKSNYPNPAFLRRRPEDDFWAAKQVMAFTNGDIRAIVETARLSDFRAAEYIIATLAQRRDKIGRVFFSKILPLDHFRVVNSELLFDDLAVKYGFKPPQTTGCNGSYSTMCGKHKMRFRQPDRRVCLPKRSRPCRAHIFRQ
jgi:hypothetical protein